MRDKIAKNKNQEKYKIQKWSKQKQRDQIG